MRTITLLAVSSLLLFACKKDEDEPEPVPVQHAVKFQVFCDSSYYLDFQGIADYTQYHPIGDTTINRTAISGTHMTMVITGHLASTRGKITVDGQLVRENTMGVGTPNILSYTVP